MTKRYIVSLGGSLIVPEEIDVNFLQSFKKIIEAEVQKGREFILITGGGRTSRRYTEAVQAVGKVDPTDLDWLGIHSTRLNAHLMRTIFRKYAHPRINTNPNQTEKATEPILIAAGYRPGYSTDTDAVVLARKYKVDTIVNLSNIDYVYEKNPKTHPDAKPLTKISWHDFRKLVGNKWTPGMNTPFDPIASKMAEKLKLKVIVMNGKPLNNLKNFLANKPYKGTLIG
jgi:uridylate kinase